MWTPSHVNGERMATTEANYLLIIRDAPTQTYDALSEAERLESMRRWNAWVDDMTARGKVAAAAPLDAAGRRVSGARGERVVDGPFAEAKELVGGFFLLSADSFDEATELARQCPNLRYGMEVEVRPLAGACHVARSLGWETMEEPASN